MTAGSGRAATAGSGRAATRVLLVDDQALLRTGFRLILESDPDLEVAGESADGLDAVEAARRLAPDVVLMDIRLPRMDGVVATRRLRARSNPPEVIVLTTFDADENILRALRAGASGFLLKDTPAEDLVTAVRVVAGGDALLSPSVTRRLIEEFARQPVGQTAQPAALASLTARELEVLKLMARGMTNGEIARDLVVSETTVKTHVGRVLDKLSLRDRVQAVVFAYETALIRPGAG